jgi:hypothetical protein
MTEAEEIMNAQRDSFGRLFTGLVIMALGAIFLADNLGFVDVGSIGRFWPVILILLGIGSIFRPGHRRGGAWLLFLGALFLLHTFGYFRLHDSWPLFIVAAGVGMIWRSVAPARTCGCTGVCTCAPMEK